jgi:Mg2+/citrate symporter
LSLGSTQGLRISQGHDGLTEIVAIELEDVLELFVGLVVTQDGTQHIVSRHFYHGRLNPVGGVGTEVGVAKRSITTGIVVDQPVDVITSIVAILLCGLSGFTELIGA